MPRLLGLVKTLDRPACQEQVADHVQQLVTDELILRLREAFGTTVVLVSHEIPSILRTADFCIYLDPETGTMGAYGPPKSFLQAGQHPKVHAFFTQARID